MRRWCVVSLALGVGFTSGCRALVSFADFEEKGSADDASDASSDAAPEPGDAKSGDATHLEGSVSDAPFRDASFDVTPDASVNLGTCTRVLAIVKGAGGGGLFMGGKGGVVSLVFDTPLGTTVDVTVGQPGQVSAAGSAPSGGLGGAPGGGPGGTPLDSNSASTSGGGGFSRIVVKNPEEHDVIAGGGGGGCSFDNQLVQGGHGQNLTLLNDDGGGNASQGGGGELGGRPGGNDTFSGAGGVGESGADGHSAIDMDGGAGVNAMTQSQGGGGGGGGAGGGGGGGAGAAACGGGGGGGSVNNLTNAASGAETDGQGPDQPGLVELICVN